MLEILFIFIPVAIIVIYAISKDHSGDKNNTNNLCFKCSKELDEKAIEVTEKAFRKNNPKTIKLCPSCANVRKHREIRIIIYIIVLAVALWIIGNISSPLINN